MKDLKKIIIKRYNNEKILERYKKYAFSGLNKIEKRLIEKYVKKGSKVLDIGCGSGRVLLALAKKYKMYGIDISKKMIEIAKDNLRKKRLKAKIKVMDACSIKFDNNFFDYVLFLGNGFEQIPEKKKRNMVLKKIYKILKPGGIFILTTQTSVYPNLKTWFLMIYQYIKYHIFKKIEKFEFGDLILRDVVDVFIHISNPFHITKILKENKFEILEIVSNNKFPYFTKNLIYYVAKKPILNRFRIHKLYLS